NLKGIKFDRQRRNSMDSALFALTSVPRRSELKFCARKNLNAFSLQPEATSNRAYPGLCIDGWGGRLRREDSTASLSARSGWMACIRRLMDRLGHAAHASFRKPPGIDRQGERIDAAHRCGPARRRLSRGSHRVLR